MSDFEESSEEIPLEWKNTKRTNPEDVRLRIGVDMNPLPPRVSVVLSDWQMKIIQNALTGRLEPNQIMVARLLGHQLRLTHLKGRLGSTAGVETMIQQCEDSIAEIYNSVEMRKLQLDAWAKAQAQQAEIPDEETEHGRTICL